MSAQDGGMNAFLGKGCSFDGKLTFEGKVKVDGQFHGEIFTKDVLEIGPDAEIKAEVDAGTVIVGGKIIGNIVASKRVDLVGSANVKGNIAAPVVTMQEGAVIDGSMRMTQGAAATRAPVQIAEAKPDADKKDPTVLP